MGTRVIIGSSLLVEMWLIEKIIIIIWWSNELSKFQNHRVIERRHKLHAQIRYIEY